MYDQLTETAVRAARRGAEVLLRYFRDADLEIHSKGRHDFATRADHESEALILSTIRERFPNHHILAEEMGYDEGTGDFHWFVDPLDGTSNFMQGLPVFSISIGCRHQGRVVSGVVLDPLGENLFTATLGGGAWWNGKRLRIDSAVSLEGAFLATGYPFKTRQALDIYLDVFRAVFLKVRSIRRCGSAALDLAYTAASVYDGFFEFKLSPWDIAAGVLLIEEAGGRVSDLDGGQEYFNRGNIIAGPPVLQAELLETVAGFVDERSLQAIEAS